MIPTLVIDYYIILLDNLHVAFSSRIYDYYILDRIQSYLMTKSAETFPSYFDQSRSISFRSTESFRKSFENCDLAIPKGRFLMASTNGWTTKKSPGWDYCPRRNCPDFKN